LKKKTKKAAKSCLKNNTILSNTAVFDIARRRVGEFLPIQADGYHCTTNQLIDVLLAVACQKDTIEQVCNDLQIKVGAETCRGYFNQQLRVENLSDLQEAVNRTLSAGFSHWLKEKDLEVAIDLHDQPYYGTSEQTEGLWVGGAAKSGTSKFYRVATAYVIKNGQRLTLAIKFVVPDDTITGVVEYLMKQLGRLEIKVGWLYLDRGFAVIEIIRYLKQIKQKAIIACPLRGRTGGTKGLCVGRKSYRTKHIFKSTKGGTEESEIAMFKGLTTSKRSGRKKQRKVKWLAYILIGGEENLSAKKVKEKYRSRFGIETSYRCSNKVRGWTTSKNVAYRFMLIAMSFVLTNIWQELQEQWTRKRQVGRRVWKWKKFRLKRFINFLRTAIENLYGMVSKIEMLN
jgi:putative transposase